jgi:hypothetical protein
MSFFTTLRVHSTDTVLDSTGSPAQHVEKYFHTVTTQEQLDSLAAKIEKCSHHNAPLAAAIESCIKSYLNKAKNNELSQWLSADPKEFCNKTALQALRTELPELYKEIDKTMQETLKALNIRRKTANYWSKKLSEEYFCHFLAFIGDKSLPLELRSAVNYAFALNSAHKPVFFNKENTEKLSFNPVFMQESREIAMELGISHCSASLAQILQLVLGAEIPVSKSGEEKGSEQGNEGQFGVNWFTELVTVGAPEVILCGDKPCLVSGMILYQLLDAKYSLKDKNKSPAKHLQGPITATTIYLSSLIHVSMNLIGRLPTTDPYNQILSAVFNFLSRSLTAVQALKLSNPSNSAQNYAESLKKFRRSYPGLSAALYTVGLCCSKCMTSVWQPLPTAVFDIEPLVTLINQNLTVTAEYLILRNEESQENYELLVYVDHLRAVHMSLLGRFTAFSHFLSLSAPNISAASFISQNYLQILENFVKTAEKQGKATIKAILQHFFAFLHSQGWAWLLQLTQTALQKNSELVAEALKIHNSWHKKQRISINTAGMGSDDVVLLALGTIFQGIQAQRIFPGLDSKFFRQITALLPQLIKASALFNDSGTADNNEEHREGEAKFEGEEEALSDGEGKDLLFILTHSHNVPLIYYPSKSQISDELFTMLGDIWDEISATPVEEFKLSTLQAALDYWESEKQLIFTDYAEFSALLAAVGGLYALRNSNLLCWDSYNQRGQIENTDSDPAARSKENFLDGPTASRMVRLELQWNLAQSFPAQWQLGQQVLEKALTALELHAEELLDHNIPLNKLAINNIRTELCFLIERLADYYISPSVYNSEAVLPQNHDYSAQLDRVLKVLCRSWTDFSIDCARCALDRIIRYSPDFSVSQINLILAAASTSLQKSVKLSGENSEELLEELVTIDSTISMLFLDRPKEVSAAPGCKELVEFYVKFLEKLVSAMEKNSATDNSTIQRVADFLQALASLLPPIGTFPLPSITNFYALLLKLYNFSMVQLQKLQKPSKIDKRKSAESLQRNADGEIGLFSLQNSVQGALGGLLMALQEFHIDWQTLSSAVDEEFPGLQRAVTLQPLKKGEKAEKLPWWSVVLAQFDDLAWRWANSVDVPRRKPLTFAEFSFPQAPEQYLAYCFDSCHYLAGDLVEMMPQNLTAEAISRLISGILRVLEALRAREELHSEESPWNILNSTLPLLRAAFPQFNDYNSSVFSARWLEKGKNTPCHLETLVMVVVELLSCVDWAAHDKKFHLMRNLLSFLLQFWPKLTWQYMLKFEGSENPSQSGKEQPVTQSLLQRFLSSEIYLYNIPNRYEFREMAKQGYDNSESLLVQLIETGSLYSCVAELRQATGFIIASIQTMASTEHFRYNLLVLLARLGFSYEVEEIDWARIVLKADLEGVYSDSSKPWIIEHIKRSLMQGSNELQRASDDLYNELRNDETLRESDIADAVLNIMVEYCYPKGNACGKRNAVERDN